jgi:D-xylose transport system permease protein
MSQAVESRSSQTEDKRAVPVEQATLGTYISNWWLRVRSGDVGSLPILAGYLVVVAIFGTLQPVFFSERNFVNLLLQMAGITAMAIGMVFVLLISEIDLSVGYVSAVGGVSMTLLLLQPSPAWPWPLAVGAALLITLGIGLLHGLIITKAGVPSFVVTLAGYLAWSGVVLIMTTIFSTGGTIVIQDDVVLAFANSYLPHLGGWALLALVLLVYGIPEFLHMQSLRRQNLPAAPLSLLILKLAGLAAAGGLAVWYANRDRGVPVVTVIILIFLVVWSFVATRTRFGRYVYAVGGNPEAARRAGINVDQIRMAAFMICSFMAGVGGIILASRLRSVDTNSGGGNLLLNVIAAAVIGGTSLFGGRGHVSSAFVGALMIATVENGMGLLLLPSGVKFVVTGLVLLAAVLVDAFSRRSREASGLV